MAALGNEFAMLLLVSGNWHSLAKLETELKRLGDSGGVTISVRRTEPRAARREVVPYSVDVVCLDQPGIVHSLSGFFSSRHRHRGAEHAQLCRGAHRRADVRRADGRQHSRQDPHRGAARGVHGLCDQLNLDAILEPVKA